MHGGPGKIVFIILAILLLIDIYAFRGVKQMITNVPNGFKTSIYIIYWMIPVFIVIMTFIIMFNMSSLASGKMYYRTFYTFMGVMVLFYVPKLLFSAFELGNDLVNGVIFLINKISPSAEISKFQWLRFLGTGIALIVFFLTFYGIIHGRYHYKINKIQISSKNIPSNFNGFTIVQISDWHIGSYYNRPHRIEDAVAKINSLNPDLILFTGDMVNNLATEIVEFKPTLKKLKAKYGIYSILGNHDYGEYVQWKSKEDKELNLEQLKYIEKEVGFKMLNNESVSINLDGQEIGLAGVENWGLPPFPQYGNLKKAIQNIDSLPYKILMSHDPSHWSAEVLDKTNIDLTLSGHTHGMQFGINTKSFKWSPVKYKYPYWAGLYNNKSQSLYVNVGIGYIGFPGRVGIRPEIALFELKSE